MPAESGTQTHTEAVAVFNDPQSMDAAIDELQNQGFDHADLSLLASEATVEEKLGHRYEKAREVTDDPGTPRMSYVSTAARGDAQGGIIGGLTYVGALAALGAVVASGGTLGVALAGAAAAGGAGGLAGAALAKLIDDKHAQYLQEQLERGGLVLWVRTRDAEHEAKAKAILAAHSGQDVHLHELRDIDAAPR